MKQLSSEASETVMIGDSENDVIAGKRAGTVTCAVSYGFRTAEQLRAAEPDLLIDRFEQLNYLFE